jgi:hypothetical protein
MVTILQESEVTCDPVHRGGTVANATFPEP